MVGKLITSYPNTTLSSTFKGSRRQQATLKSATVGNSMHRSYLIIKLSVTQKQGVPALIVTKFSETRLNLCLSQQRFHNFILVHVQLKTPLYEILHLEKNINNPKEIFYDCIVMSRSKRLFNDPSTP